MLCAVELCFRLTLAAFTVCSALGFNLDIYDEHGLHAKARIGYTLSEQYPCSHPGSAEGIGMAEDAHEQTLNAGRIQWNAHSNHYHHANVDVFGPTASMSSSSKVACTHTPTNAQAATHSDSTETSHPFHHPPITPHLILIQH
eukprot:SAG11_NODE_7773_length_1097_cov_1.730461_2_plen_143_part_00